MAEDDESAECWLMHIQGVRSRISCDLVYGLLPLANKESEELSTTLIWEGASV